METLKDSNNKKTPLTKKLPTPKLFDNLLIQIYLLFCDTFSAYDKNLFQRNIFLFIYRVSV